MLAHSPIEHIEQKNKDANYRIQQWNTNRKARNMVSISVGYRLKFDL